MTPYIVLLNFSASYQAHISYDSSWCSYSVGLHVCVVARWNLW